MCSRHPTRTGGLMGRARNVELLGIPQAWSAVILGDVSGRSRNTDFFDSDYWQRKLLEQYAHNSPFRELDDAVGIAQDDWWMVDERGQRLSFMQIWLDHRCEQAFDVSVEP